MNGPDISTTDNAGCSILWFLWFAFCSFIITITSRVHGESCPCVFLVSLSQPYSEHFFLLFFSCSLCTANNQQRNGRGWSRRTRSHLLLHVRRWLSLFERCPMCLYSNANMCAVRTHVVEIDEQTIGYFISSTVVVGALNQRRKRNG